MNTQLLKLLSSISPSNPSRDSQVGIVTLSCHKDIVRLILMLHSFRVHSGHELPITVVDDGSFTRADTQLLSVLFGVQIVSLQDLMNSVNKKIQNFPRISHWIHDTEGSKLRFKVPLLLRKPYSKTLYLDSDILFTADLSNSTLQRWITGQEDAFLYLQLHPSIAAHRQDVSADHYHFLQLILKHYKLQGSAFFNSGLIGISRGITHNELSLLEDMVTLFYEIDFAHHVLAEESLLSVLSSRGTPLDPEKYCTVINSQMWNCCDATKAVLLHFAHDAKKHMIDQAVSTQVLFGT